MYLFRYVRDSYRQLVTGKEDARRCRIEASYVVDGRMQKRCLMAKCSECLCPKILSSTQKLLVRQLNEAFNLSLYEVHSFKLNYHLGGQCTDDCIIPDLPKNQVLFRYEKQKKSLDSQRHSVIHQLINCPMRFVSSSADARRKWGPR